MAVTRKFRSLKNTAVMSLIIALNLQILTGATESLAGATNSGNLGPTIEPTIRASELLQTAIALNKEKGKGHPEKVKGHYGYEAIMPSKTESSVSKNFTRSKDERPTPLCEQTVTDVNPGITGQATSNTPPFNYQGNEKSLAETSIRVADPEHMDNFSKTDIDTLETSSQTDAPFRSCAAITDAEVVGGCRFGCTETCSGLTSTTPNPFALINTGMISSEQYRHFSLSLTLVVGSVITLIGLSGNAIIFIIFLKNKSKIVLQDYLMALCMTDTIHLLIMAWYIVCQIVAVFDTPRGTTFQAFTFPVLNVFLYLVVLRLSAVFTALLSVERMVAVMWPLYVQNFVLRRHSKNIMVGITLLITVFLGPQLFKYSHQWVFDPQYNRTRLVNRPTDFYKNSGRFYPMMLLVSHVLFLQAPTVVLIITSIGITVSLRKATKKRENLQVGQRWQRKQSEATRVVLLLSVSSAACYLPGSFAYIFNFLNPSFGMMRKEHYLYYTILEINGILTVINSSINILVYLRFNSTFRRTLKLLCCRNKYEDELSMTTACTPLVSQT